MGRALEKLELVGTGPWNEVTQHLVEDEPK